MRSGPPDSPLHKNTDMSPSNGATADPPRVEPPSAWHLLRKDLSELLSIQGRLFMKESRTALRHAYLAAEVVAAGMVIAALAGALLVFGGADELYANTDLTLGQSRLIIGAVLTVIAIVVLRKGIGSCRAAGRDFDLSVEELQETSRFLSQLVSGSKQPPTTKPVTPSTTLPSTAGGSAHVRRF